MFKKPNKEKIKENLKISAKITKKEIHKRSLKVAIIFATLVLGFFLYSIFSEYSGGELSYGDWSLFFFYFFLFPFCVGLLVYFLTYFTGLVARWTSKKQLAFLSRAEDSKDVNDFFKSKEIKKKEKIQKETGKKVKDLEEDLFD